MIEFANTLPDDDPFDRFFVYANVGGVYKNIIFGAAGRLCDFGPTTTANLVSATVSRLPITAPSRFTGSERHHRGLPCQCAP